MVKANGIMMRVNDKAEVMKECWCDFVDIKPMIRRHTQHWRHEIPENTVSTVLVAT